MRLVEQEEECGPGEPYKPVDVDILFDERTVALRGPWNPFDLVKVAPIAADLDGLYQYHLDYPGNALEPGCSYELWGRRISEGSEPTVYAHVVGDPGHPGMLALQYWLFYVFNDWNNLHEGDWEMIQLVFEAEDAREALTQEPVSIGYSQHEGGEAATWGEEKLDLVDGRHPVVYPGAGSHANFFDEALYIGSSAQQGVGCDDTRGPHRELSPVVKTIPSDAAAATGGVSLDRLRRALGRAPGSVLQRAHRAPTTSFSGRSRSCGPRSGETAPTACRPAVSSGRARPTSSATRSQPARWG